MEGEHNICWPVGSHFTLITVRARVCLARQSILCRAVPIRCSVPCFHRNPMLHPLRTPEIPCSSQLWGGTSVEDPCRNENVT